MLGLQRSLHSAAARLRYSSLNSVRHCYLDPPEAELPDGFHFFPDFLNDQEQRILLGAALRELDANGPPGAKRNLRRGFKGKDIYHPNAHTIQDLFLSEESGCYAFEEGHYDGVIQHFREMYVSAWPPNPALDSILHRIRTLLPTSLPRDAILTHILHLSSKGEIFPHIDNVESSGSWIAAVSLGHERVLRMEGPNSFEVLLPSGSAYVQTDPVRYLYKHSILCATTFKSRPITSGQRVSIMLRDRFKPCLKERL